MDALRKKWKKTCVFQKTVWQLEERQSSSDSFASALHLQVELPVSSWYGARQSTRIVHRKLSIRTLPALWLVIVLSSQAGCRHLSRCRKNYVHTIKYPVIEPLEHIRTKIKSPWNNQWPDSAAKQNSQGCCSSRLGWICAPWRQKLLACWAWRLRTWMWPCSLAATCEIWYGR